MWSNKIVLAVSLILLGGCDGASTGEDNAREKVTANVPNKLDKTPFERQPGSLDSSTGGFPQNPGVKEPAATDVGTSDGSKVSQLEDRAINAKEPEARIEALRELVEKDKEAAMPVIEEALQDTEDDVRKEALSLTHSKQLLMPYEVLHDIALNDPSDQVRGMAGLNIIDQGQPDEARQYLLDALNDRNPDIRRDAKLYLDKFEKQRRW